MYQAFPLLVERDAFHLTKNIGTQSSSHILKFLNQRGKENFSFPVTVNLWEGFSLGSALAHLPKAMARIHPCDHRQWIVMEVPTEPCGVGEGAVSPQRI